MSCASVVPGVGDGEGVDVGVGVGVVVDVGVGVGVAVDVGVGVGVAVDVGVGVGVGVVVGVGVGVGDPPSAVARNEVAWNVVPVVPLCVRMRRPQNPDCSELSVAVTIQFAGSVVPVCQTLADSDVPTMRNRKV